MIETRGLAISIEVADAMLKAANVSIVNQEKVVIPLITIFVEGDVSAVQVAVDAGAKVAHRAGALISSAVIPQPGIGVRSIVK